MKRIANGRLWITIACLFIGGLFTACNSTPEPHLTPLPEGTYEADPVFREFYGRLGGVDTLGNCISPVFKDRDVNYQYTENSLMVYDPSKSTNQRFYLAPLGNEWDKFDPPLAVDDQANVRIVNGHVIYAGFLAAYDALGGARYAGPPLTHFRYNAEAKRYEQYFANVGFYRLESDPPTQARLLPYGAWKCDNACRSPHEEAGVLTKSPPIAQPLGSNLQGSGTILWGKPISEARELPGGQAEQVYENVVIFGDPHNPSGVQRRPLPELIGFKPAILSLRIADERLTFYPIDGEKGYNIPVIFYDYIMPFGGLEATGQPITEIFPYEGIYRQCFKYLCLDYDPNDPGDKIRPASLGRRYSNQPLPSAPDAVAETPVDPVKVIQIKAWEDFDTVDSLMAQGINVRVWDGSTANPMQNIELILTLYLPDGAKTYHFLPTDANGSTSLKLPPIPAGNGTLINYQVCLATPGSESLCTDGSFLIWGNP